MLLTVCSTCNAPKRFHARRHRFRAGGTREFTDEEYARMEAAYEERCQRMDEYRSKREEEMKRKIARAEKERREISIEERVALGILEF